MKVRLDWLRDPVFHLALIAAAVACVSAWRGTQDVDPLSFAHVVSVSPPIEPALSADRHAPRLEARPSLEALPR